MLPDEKWVQLPSKLITHCYPVGQDYPGIKPGKARANSWLKIGASAF